MAQSDVVSTFSIQSTITGSYVLTRSLQFADSSAGNCAQTTSSFSLIASCVLVSLRRTLTWSTTKAHIAHVVGSPTSGDVRWWLRMRLAASSWGWLPHFSLAPSHILEGGWSSHDAANQRANDGMPLAAVCSHTGQPPHCCRAKPSAASTAASDVTACTSSPAAMQSMHGQRLSPPAPSPRPLPDAAPRTAPPLTRAASEARGAAARQSASVSTAQARRLVAIRVIIVVVVVVPPVGSAPRQQGRGRLLGGHDCGWLCCCLVDRVRGTRFCHCVEE
mmetsp:Transcript_40349/g.120352  ORF Transcript_40349/g.120352 Transcript_40349/m.120352 type:complete len:276 (+) Transcript_40349:1816-2643(+)